MLLGLGFVGKSLYRELKPKNIGDCTIWDHPANLARVFEAKEIGHQTGNYDLVCQWARQLITTQSQYLGKCCLWPIING